MDFKLQILCLVTVATVKVSDASDNDYIRLNLASLEKRYGVNGENAISFRIFSTKHAGMRGIEFDEDTQTASLKDSELFDKSLDTKIIVHGNGGGLRIDEFLWDNYTKVAEQKGRHYNIIGIRWGKGGTPKHAYTGIKLAKVVKSFVEKYGLDVSSIHGIGFRYNTFITKLTP